MRRKRCSVCDKFCYGRDDALHAALGTARTTGCSVRVYRCPADKQIFHVTTKAARKRKPHHGSS